MLAAVLALLAAQVDPPSAAAAVCYNGGCIAESFGPWGPAIVFFADGAASLDDEGVDVLSRFVAQHRWWPDWQVLVCAPPPRTGGSDRGRLAYLRRMLARGGYRAVTIRHEGRDCPAFASRRAAGLVGYQLTLAPPATPR